MLAKEGLDLLTLRQPGSRPFSDLLHVLMKYPELRVSVKGMPASPLFAVALVESTEGWC
jgi:hypothetical protein